MSDEGRLDVVLLWHMHQPQYADASDRGYYLPWTYLHTIKDYVDMAAHLEAVPEARVVVNFAPTLLEQIDDYAQMVRDYLDRSAAIRDPLLAALAGPELPAEPAHRARLVVACLRSNERRLIERFPDYQRLVEIARRALADPRFAAYLNDQYILDLVVWYHLAWMGETVRRNDARIHRLMDKGCGYSVVDRLRLLSIMAELLSGVIDRYRRLAQRDQVELSFTPYAHPIAPLMLDMDSASDASPELDLDGLEPYPHGRERLDWHIREGLATFERHFGFAPQGCWPAEGAVSDATLRRLDRHGLRWTASGEQVLANSLRRAPKARAPSVAKEWLFHGYRLARGRLACFFRDDGLSDSIGFRYGEWRTDDAVEDFIGHLERIATHHGHRAGAVVAVILDGENAWEYYPENGYWFLRTLYEGLSTHPKLRLTTFADHLNRVRRLRALPPLVAGSWVHGTLSTWVGEPDKNRGWQMLIEAKRAFDDQVAHGRLEGAALGQAQRQLGICEGSDWFWWFGPGNPAESVRDFDELYRRHLANLYRLIDKTAPTHLDSPFTFGGGAPAAGGVMRPGIDS
jgi:alpha-amylase/alpha-mannosidase (GH57 family)